MAKKPLEEGPIPMGGHNQCCHPYWYMDVADDMKRCAQQTGWWHPARTMTLADALKLPRPPSSETDPCGYVAFMRVVCTTRNRWHF